MPKTPRKDRKPVYEPAYDAEQIVSFSECTGIMPIPVQNEAEAESCAALYALHKPQTDEESEQKK